MEGDTTRFHECDRIIISIHSLRMEGDLKVSEITDITGVFQSTPSAWRETLP